MHNQTTGQLRAAASPAALLIGALLLAAPTWAQAQQADDQEATTVDEIVVTGIRASLASALSEKRRSNTIVDVINAEDIADFPDANLANYDAYKKYLLRAEDA